MSDSGSHSPDPDTNFETTFISSLAVYTKGSGKKAKESKSIKVKEFDFSVSEDNYLEFLCEFLESQSQDKYQVAIKKHYGFKYLYPPSKVYVAIYIIVLMVMGAENAIGPIMQWMLTMRRTKNIW